MPEHRLGRTDQQLQVAGLKECSACHLCYKLKGFPRHFATCSSWKTGRDEAIASTSAVGISVPDNAISVPPNPAERASGTTHYDIPWPLSPEATASAAMEMEVDHQIREGPTQDVDGSSGLHPGTPEPTYEEGSIRVHVQARPGRIVRKDHTVPPKRRRALDQADTAPWWPFITHADFRFARVALASGINAAQINEYLSIHHLASDCPLTLRNAKELHTIQARAEHLLAPYREVQYSVPLRATNPKDCVDFTVWIMPLMDWILQLVLDLQVQKDLRFDSVEKFRLTDGEWVRFVDEPWTADDWPKLQETLPEDGLLISIILYADKALASSWGTKKLYPVIARLANLPRQVRNGRGVGGGRVVALLPVVEKASDYGLGVTSFANFKCNVWHRGVEKLLDTIRLEAKFGYAVELELHRALNLEKKAWRLFPAIPIISADLEEQYAMGCQRGTNALCSCPRCLQSGDLLFDLSRSAKYRNFGDFIKMMERAKHMNVGKTEAMLREYSYRPVENAFSTLGERTDLFRALSYDTLHNDDLGRWGSHIWPMLKEFIDANCSQSISAEFEAKIAAVPPWPDLNHFPNALSMGFSDGTKYEDLLKVVLHGSMALPAQASSLVALVRKQAELRVLASLDVHTEDTLALGRKVVSDFYKISLECTKKYGKNFNFPKMHMVCHLFDDVWNKGGTANFSTKPNEQMHGKLRRAYGVSSKKLLTVDSEVLHTTHAAAVYELIAAEIEEWQASQVEELDEHDETDDETDPDSVVHVTLRSRDKTTSTELLEDKHANNPACRNLDTRIHDIIDELVPSFIQPTDKLKVRECHQLRVQYESQVDWCLHRDILRCSPMVYNKPRYDCVFVNHEDGIRLARLHLLLECKASANLSETIFLALVSYFEPVLRSIGVIERATGFRRYRQLAPSKSELIPLRSIVRGALLVSLLDPANKEDFLANDLVDQDMYLRFLSYTAKNTM
ncbi:hypothetical protein FS749_002904 [Ceratobasidium sp. UAMH 11750]|nr:hypothetical protein FS749_002904 [Ceratobasidium sp. UAMH 11750]